MEIIPEIIEIFGYNHCLANKNGRIYQQFEKMYAQDDLLFEYKNSKDTSFQKKASLGLKVLGSIMVMPRSCREDSNGEEWPVHIASLQYLHKKVRKME